MRACEGARGKGWHCVCVYLFVILYGMPGLSCLPPSFVAAVLLTCRICCVWAHRPPSTSSWGPVRCWPASGSWSSFTTRCGHTWCGVCAVYAQGVACMRRVWRVGWCQHTTLRDSPCACARAFATGASSPQPPALSPQLPLLGPLHPAGCANPPPPNSSHLLRCPLHTSLIQASNPTTLPNTPPPPRSLSSVPPAFA